MRSQSVLKIYTEFNGDHYVLMCNDGRMSPARHVEAGCFALRLIQ